MTIPDPVLLTPGPLTTSPQTKAAMLRDWGSWDSAFNALTASVCADIVDVVHAADTHVCIPLQGSGTFAVEAALGSFVPRRSKTLVPSNGAYCLRIARILRYLGREFVVLDHPESRAIDPERIDAALREDADITHVAQVHCETGTGVLNPLPRIAGIVAAHGRRLIVDAMSSFGALPIDLRTMPVDALIAASGKCLEGVPGMGFVVARRTVVESAAGCAHSLALDLHDQWTYLQKTGQWRFTPPTHVVAALRAAIDQFTAEGGQPARLARYMEHCAVLVDGMRSLGFETFIGDDVQAPIIVTFHAPPDPAYDFTEFYRRMRARGFVIYPGKLTAVETFRVGCIGALRSADLRRAVDAIAATVREMGIEVMAPTSLSNLAG